MASSPASGKPVPESRRQRSTIIERHDASGTYWTLVADSVSEVELFWVQETRLPHICIRQQAQGDDEPDVILLSAGQAYDLLIALSKALDIDIPTPKLGGRGPAAPA